MKRLAVAVGALCTASCVPTPESYHVPPQHSLGLKTASGEVLREFFRSGDLGADAFLVKDVQGSEGNNQRWVYGEPEFRFYIASTRGRHLRVEFTVHEVTFRDTGPVTIVFLVNGHELGRVTYDRPGQKVFHKQVPEAWLRTGEENRVIARVLNPWQAPDPDVRLGFVLHAAGFVKP